MMNYVWAVIILLSCVFSVINGTTEQVVAAILESGGETITTMITIGGGMCVWGGLCAIAQEAGITKFISRIFSPLLRLIMPDIPPHSPAGEAVCMNIAANLMGLGNAATPLGIKAMREMSALSADKTTATRSMSVFVVLNTASLQLIPTTLAVLRRQYGAAHPLDILPCILVTAPISLAAGLAMFYALSGRRGR